MKKLLLTSMLALATMCVCAQSLGDVPATVSADDVTVLKENVLVFAEHDSIAYNAKAGKMDTLRVRDGARVFSPEEFELLSREPKRLRAAVVPGEQWGNDNGSDGIYGVAAVILYTYKYPSVDADGNIIYLSALMGLPTNYSFWAPAMPNNLIIGCHETITSNFECPSEFTATGEAPLKSGNCMMLQYCRFDMSRHPCCLVIMPDYEGYGISKDRAHPYLYQELTARQVVDAVRSGLAFYNHLVNTGNAKPFEPNWKSVSIGYSQGGSVSLATHKFIEQNGLVDELHFAGSVCGDGPYDPVAHLRYYMNDDGETYDGNNRTIHRKEKVSMPIVMPLILKGMCDSNPLMRQHYVDDYLSARFLLTESIKFIEAKSNKYKEDQYNTDRINKEYVKMMREGKTGTYVKNYHDSEGSFTLTMHLTGLEFQEVMEFYDPGLFSKMQAHGLLNKMMTDTCYKYFKHLTANTPVPTKSGLMEDLHRALESNNLTKGWTPQHRVAFFHSTYDTVVPYENLLSFIRNQQSLTYYFVDKKRSRTRKAGVNCTTASKKDANVYIRDATCKDDHVDAGSNFFMTGAEGAFGFEGLSPDMQMIKWVLTGDDK